MIVETIVDEPSTLKTAQIANALIPMEVGVGQLDLINNWDNNSTNSGSNQHEKDW